MRYFTEWAGSKTPSIETKERASLVRIEAGPSLPFSAQEWRDAFSLWPERKR